MVLRVQNALCHKYLYDVEECWVAVQVKSNLVQNRCLLRHELVLLAIKSHVIAILTTLQGSEAALVGHLITLLLHLRWFVARELSQELS